jgi:hypothetical protein
VVRGGLRRWRLVTGACAAVIAMAGCSSDGSPRADPRRTESPTSSPREASQEPTLPLSVPTATPLDAPVPTDDALLRDELLDMLAADQVERTGGGLPPGTKLPPARDYDRAQRLRRIVEARGWPTHDEVGKQGGTAAWLVAQHADFDVAFQQWALAQMTAALREGQADRTEVAYLADRVAVNTGAPQVYGSQVRCRDGKPRPATPLKRPDDIAGLRHRVGMEPLREYYAELAMMCADEAAAGQEAGPG